MKKGIVLLVLILIILLLGILEFFGVIWHTELFARSYSVKGLDVSNHQHAINWDKVSSKDYQFIFVKATEGRNFIDKSFDVNWKGAKSKGFLVGAYHFFVMTSTGEEQASNFIKAVPNEKDSLPAVIDVEVSTKEEAKMVIENLNEMIEMIAEAYGKEPILYVTYDTYNSFIKGYFTESKIWIRDIFKRPKLEDCQDWVFWQYSNRGKIDGIDTYVDINVYKGNKNELLELIK